MPPLCTCGYSIANRNLQMLGGAVYLFAVNAYFIFLASSVILSAMRIPKVRELRQESLAKVNGHVENAPMMILDEATSSVDTRTEARIQKAMYKLTENRTSFVIAHRLSTIRDADVIIYMQDGDIKETGTHEQLMQRNGLYAELYNSQFAMA